MTRETCRPTKPLRRNLDRSAACWGVVAAAALALLCGCRTPPTGERLEAKLREAGASVHGFGRESSTFPIEADSKMAAWTLEAEARRTGPLPLSRQLARRMDLAAKRGHVLIVGGAYPALTREVVLGAFAANGGKPLPGLVLVYVGSAESAGDVRRAAAAAGVRFVQRELP
jgi:hypothetical protein